MLYAGGLGNKGYVLLIMKKVQKTLRHKLIPNRKTGSS